MTKHVGFTGTQRGMSREQLQHLEGLLSDMRELGYDTFHHGDCVGADAQAHDIAVALGYRVVIHPPEISSKRAFKDGCVLPAKDYHERNHDIVDSSRLMIAAPDTNTEIVRSGTWATVRYARAQQASGHLMGIYTLLPDDGVPIPISVLNPSH